MRQKLFRVGELGVGNGKTILALAHNTTPLNAEFFGVDLRPPFAGKNLE